MASRRLIRSASSLVNSTSIPITPSRPSWISSSSHLQSLQQSRLPSNRRTLATGADNDQYWPSQPPIKNPTDQVPLEYSDGYPQNVGLPSLGGLEPSFTADGVPGLLSKKGFEIAWTTYQQFIMKKLANLVAGEGIDIHNPRAIAIQYARDPMNASLFNHASMVHNNHFFFQGLSTRPIPLEHEKALQAKLVAQFGSVENLRTSFIESAAGMFGPGFTWLVWNPSTRQQGTGGFKILNTYGAGTPYGEAGHRRQETDMSNSSSTPSYGQMGAYSKSGQKDGGLAPGAARLYPLMCVNTWQHVYLYEYGVEGKREFLNRWWDVIDWSVVQRTLKAVEGTMAKSGNAARGSGARKFLER